MSTHTICQQERIAAAAGCARALDAVLAVAPAAGARRPWTATNPTFAVMASKHGSTPAPRPEEAVP